MSTSSSSKVIDFTSLDFDPDIVLRSENVKLPYPAAKTFNNLIEFENYVIKGLETKQKKENAKEIPKTDEKIENIENKNFNEESTGKQDVLKRMKSAFSKGPLNVLNKCVQDRRRVKVTTRNYCEIRGTCTGYIEAFDKHWNLAMRDVDEVYTKSTKLKTPILRKFKPDEFSVVTEDIEKDSDLDVSETIQLHQSTYSSESDNENEIEDICDISDLCETSTICLYQFSETELKKAKKPYTEKLRNTCETESPNQSSKQEMIQIINSEKKSNTETELSKQLESDCNILEKTIEDKEKKHKLEKDIKTYIDGNKAVSKLQRCKEKRKKNKVEICKRHVNQLFIRGDNVVFIRLLEFPNVC